MRTIQELAFRLRQEVGNLRLGFWPLSSEVTLQNPRSCLPDPAAAAARLRGTRFSAEAERLAELVLQHRFPLPGGVVETGPQIEWRRDYRTGVVSQRRYFRLIRFLDVRQSGDHKVIWDLNRHQHLILLAQAFLLTERTAFVDEIEKQVESWFADNPPMRGINWTSALEVAFRALSWMWVLQLVGIHLQQRVRRSMLRGLYQHACYLERNLSFYFSPNTHLLGEAVALHALGSMFPEFPGADHWKARGSTIVRAQMRAQVREDGSHFEQSTYYHVYALDMFLFHQILEDAGEEFRTSLWRMADYLWALMAPDRTLPSIGDDDGGRFFHPYGDCDQFGRATLATCAILLNESKWLVSAADLHEQAAWWLGERSLGRTPTESSTPSRSRIFTDSGIAVMSRGPMQVLFDAGSFGRGSAGHSHSDALSVVVRNSGQHVLIDPGTFTYVAEDPAMRAWFRGSAAHNLVMVDGQDQGTAAGPFRWRDCSEVNLSVWRSEENHDLIDAGWRKPKGAQVAHRRQAVFLKRVWAAGGILVIRDTVTGDPGVHEVAQLWHPGEHVTRINPEHIVIGRGNHLLVSQGQMLDEIAGWRSRCFGETSAAPVLTARRHGEFPVLMWAALVMCEDADTPGPSTMCAEGRRVTISWDDGSTLSVHFGEDDVSYQIDRARSPV